MDIASLLNTQLVLVTGKGGTGKTTYSAALGLLGAAQGKRTIVCEIDNQRPSMGSIFGCEPDFAPRQAHALLDVCNIVWMEALATYLSRTLPMNRLVRRILENEVVHRFLDFTPGSRELVILSRLGQLCDEYDLVVVDMPASGHAFSMLDILRSIRELFRAGPVRQRADELMALIDSERTAVALVALPEEMVVNETLETHERLRTSGLLYQEPTVFLNRATLPSMTEAERQLLNTLDALELDGLSKEFVRAGRWEDVLEQHTAEASERFTEHFDSPPLLTPVVSSGGYQREVTGHVAAHMGRQVGITRRDLRWT